MYTWWCILPTFFLVCVFVCLFASLFVCLLVCLLVQLIDSLFVCLFVCLFVYLYFSNFLMASWKVGDDQITIQPTLPHDSSHVRKDRNWKHSHFKLLGRSSHLVSKLFHPSYKWINPTYLSHL